tara:strand:+ start:69437 stop:70972 length:1536 start_codon:yes stop_codon:yes gene_type:complete
LGGYLTQPLKRAASLFGDRLAVIDGDTRYSWAQLQERVARMAGALHDRGIREGDRVAILAYNSFRYFELHFALPWAGAVMVPLNTRLAPAENEFQLRDSQPRLLFVDTEMLPSLDSMGDIRDTIDVVVLDPASGANEYESMIEGAVVAPDRAPGGDSLAGLFYTGGSTGRPKGVMLSHDNLLQNAVNTLIGVGYDETSRYLHAAPMFHLTDGMATYSVTMAGGIHAFVPRFDAVKVLEQVQAHQITNLTLVPTMIEMLAREAERGSYDVSSMRQFQFGSSPMPDATLERALRVWPDTLFLHGWGMTEISPIGTMLPHHLRDPKVAGARLRSVGIPAPNEEIRIVDENDEDVPRGQVGELIVRGPMVMLGYWNQPDITAETLRGGWMHTGDAAWQDEEGLLYIADRLKDMIISGGENVYSTEVESVVGLFPGVREAAVFGLPHEKWGEMVCAAVLPEDGVELDLDALEQFVRSRIAAYKVPKKVFVRTAPLPLTSAGKLSKKTLREEYAPSA